MLEPRFLIPVFDKILPPGHVLSLSYVGPFSRKASQKNRIGFSLKGRIRILAGYQISSALKAPGRWRMRTMSPMLL
ncbi:MAG TPA: hypothetical protein PK154_08065, partial [Methanoregulaceae archaeon]|nr:hypothetical protein [Methanoregulaceae archaeon]